MTARSGKPSGRKRVTAKALAPEDRILPPAPSIPAFVADTPETLSAPIPTLATPPALTEATPATSTPAASALVPPASIALQTSVPPAGALTTDATTQVRQVTPSYWDDACRHLSKRDRMMRKLIPRYGEGRLQCRGDAFTTLARSIVGQQISVKAAQAVWDRFAALMVRPAAHLTPAGVLGLEPGAARAAGLSVRKVEYLLDLAAHFQSSAVHVGQWQEMDDEAIIDELVAIRGIGRWTAEMFLIFHLMRPDVLPLDDVGLLKGIGLNYFSGESVSRAEARDVAEAWVPFRSVATWYIWRSLDPLPVDY